MGARDTDDEFAFAATLAHEAPPSARASRATLRPRSTVAVDAANELERPDTKTEASWIEVDPSDVIGEGGMGLVLRARQPSLRRSVAVKTLRPGVESAAAREAFVREAWVTGSLEHPNIPPVHALGVLEDGRPALVMKRIEGQSWEHALDARSPDEVRAHVNLEHHLRVLCEVTKAVAFAHDRGIVHRDLKPANVIVGPFGEVLVLDWGLALAIDARADAGGDAYPPQGVVGTPAYMAPEMAREEMARIGPRTDAYLLGAILHEIVVGAAPHARGSVIESLAAAGSGLVEPIPEHVPGELRAILLRALAEDPDDRVAGASELRREIEAFLGHEHSRALTKDGLEQLRQLEAAADATAAHDAFVRCRFAFMRALRDFAENEEAASGLRRALVHMATRHLDAGDAEAAAALVDELVVPEADLVSRLETARRARTELARELVDLRSTARDVDLSIAKVARSRFFLGVGLLWGGSAFGAGVLVRRGVMTLSYEGRYPYMVAMLIVIAVVALTQRASLMQNLVNRRFLLAALTLQLIPVVSAVSCDVLDIPVAPSIVLEMLLTFFMLLGIAIFLEPLVVWGALAFGAFFTAALFSPARVLELYGLGVVAAFFSAAYASRRA